MQYRRRIFQWQRGGKRKGPEAGIHFLGSKKSKKVRDESRMNKMDGARRWGRAMGDTG